MWLWVWLFCCPVYAEIVVFHSPDGTVIDMEKYAAAGKTAVVWLPAEHGFVAEDRQIAQQLQRLGYEIWLVKLLEAYFLPAVPSSLDQIEGHTVSAVVSFIQTHSMKSVVLMSANHGAALLLRGLADWQATAKVASPKVDSLALAVHGAVLLSPIFFNKTPEPGETPSLYPVVAAFRHQMVIIQPEKSPWHWHLPATVKRLNKQGSHVLIKTLPKVRDRFYYRPDATAAEIQQAVRLPGQIAAAVEWLKAQRRPIAQSKAMTANDVTTQKNEPKIKIFAGAPLAPPLKLSNLQGQVVDLAALVGKVKIINFWASWCPPCIHEMPSLQLRFEQMQDKMVLLAVNIAEPKNEITRFLKDKVKVNFPILMDEKGTTVKKWKVYAFPSSFILDKNNRMRYGVYGAVDWMSTDITKILEQLSLENP